MKSALYPRSCLASQKKRSFLQCSRFSPSYSLAFARTSLQVDCSQSTHGPSCSSQLRLPVSLEHVSSSMLNSKFRLLLLSPTYHHANLLASAAQILTIHRCIVGSVSCQLHVAALMHTGSPVVTTFPNVANVKQVCDPRKPEKSYPQRLMCCYVDSEVPVWSECRVGRMRSYTSSAKPSLCRTSVADRDGCLYQV